MNRAVVLFMPVFHRGYENFLAQFSNCPIYIICSDIIDELDNEKPDKVQSVIRDPRRIDPLAAIRILRILDFNSVPLSMKEVPELCRYDEIVMPEDSFSHVVAHKFAHIWPKVTFVDYFLRWDMKRSLSPTPDCADATMSVSELRELGLFRFVEEAKAQAMRSPDWWRQVGAVLVKDGKQVLTAFNNHVPHEFENYFAGDPRANFDAGKHIEVSNAVHAEATLISVAAKEGICTRGCELFVTTFPCPPCAYHIALSGVKRVYFIDGYSVVSAADTLKEFGVELVHVI